MPDEPPGAAPDSSRDLFPLVYEELRSLARRYLDTERPDHTLQPTALVHEAFLRLHAAEDGTSTPWASRHHFLQTAARAMRRILVDRARARRSGKRGGNLEKVSLDQASEVFEPGSVDLVVLDDALTSLHRIDPQLTRIVELRFFAGLTIEETAAALEVSTPTIERGWRVARLWLRRAIAGHGAEPSP